MIKRLLHSVLPAKKKPKKNLREKKKVLFAKFPLQPRHCYLHGGGISLGIFHIVQLFSQFLGKHFKALYLWEHLSKHLHQHLINGVFKPGSSFCKLILWSLMAAVEQGRHSGSVNKVGESRGAAPVCVCAQPHGKVRPSHISGRFYLLLLE